MLEKKYKKKREKNRFQAYLIEMHEPQRTFFNFFSNF
jgi:hypothetical protein